MEERRRNIGNASKSMIAALPPLHYFAFGIFLVWSYFAFTTGLWVDPDLETDGSAISNVFISSTVAFVIVCIACACKGKQVTRIMSSGRALTATGIAATLCCVILYLCGPDYLLGISATAATATSLACAFGAGAATSLLAARCAMFFAALPPKKAWYRVCENQLLAVAVYFIVIGNPEIVQNILFCLLPLIAALMLASEKLRPPKPEAVPNFERNTIDPGLLKRFCLVLAILNLTESLFRSMYIYQIDPMQMMQSDNAAMMVRLLIALVIYVCIGSITTLERFGRLYYASVLLVIAIALFAGIIPTGEPAVSAVFLGAYTCFEMFTWCCIAHIAYRTTVEPLAAYGQCWGSLTFGGLIGALIGVLAAHARLTQAEMAIPYTVLVLLCAIVVMFVFGGKQFAELTSSFLSSDDVLFTPTRARMVRKADKEIRFIPAVERFSDSLGLTPREQEIAQSLLENMQVNEIANRYSLSINTVRRHIQNIYSKANVHSREEFTLCFIEASGYRRD